MICRTCGAAIVESDKFCGDCGRAVIAVLQPCQTCGFPTREGARFCIKCGTTLERISNGRLVQESALAARAHESAPRVQRAPALADQRASLGTPDLSPPHVPDANGASQISASWSSRLPLAIVALGCILGIAVYLSLSLDDAGTAEGVRPADGAPAAVSGTLGTTRPNVGDFSIKHAFTQLYGNYDPNLDGAFWKATAAPSALQEWNGRDLFIRPLISKEFVDAGNARHVLVTNSLAVKNSDVVKQGTGCRTCGSLIGAAVFERQSHGWKLISRHDFLTADGRWGAPPKVTLSFPGSGGIELQFEPRSGEPGEPIKQRHTIVLKERKERAPAVARSSARDEAKK